MDFVHRDQDFDDLLRIVAADRGLALDLIEKDYWVTHALWSLIAQEFEIWLKGGTSLSKGFDLITRFSEDLDLKLEPGSVHDLPPVSNWRSQGKTATDERRAHFKTLARLLVVPDAVIAVQDEEADHWRSARIHIEYPRRYSADLGPLSPYVLLEFGSARVTPFVERPVTSFVHEYLEAQDLLGSYLDNRPQEIRCVHPLVTLIEKLDALQRRALNNDREPSSFVRHYEDAARIILGTPRLPELNEYGNAISLVSEMAAEGQIRQVPSSTDASFIPDASPRWTAIRAAYDEIAPMFWGDRISLEDACKHIREWISSKLH